MATNYIKDNKGRIIKVIMEDKSAQIIWTKEDLSIDFCNLVIMIACSTRGVGGEGG